MTHCLDNYDVLSPYGSGYLLIINIQIHMVRGHHGYLEQVYFQQLVSKESLALQAIQFICLYISQPRDCFPKFANGLNIKIGIAQKVYEL